MSGPTNLPPNGPPGGPPSAANDQAMRRVELVISVLLRVGVVVSLLLIIAGTIMSFVHHPEYAKLPAELPGLVQPESAPLRSIGGVVTGLGDKRGQAVVTLGLLVLIATPMMRVGVSIVAFFLERDWVYTLITSGVFCLLILSLVLGAAE